MNGMIIMYNLTCITNYNSIYSHLTVCTLSCTMPHNVSIELFKNRCSGKYPTLTNQTMFVYKVLVINVVHTC